MTTQAIQKIEPQQVAASPMQILEAAIRGGITQENVTVVKELAAMCREQRAEDAKIAFNKAFFEMRKEMPIIYADKVVNTKGGKKAFEYCSPEEIDSILDPLLKRFGFCTMTSQEKDANGFITATLTLFHESGHSEKATFTVRPPAGNELMDAPKCDAAGTTNAERHAKIKMFGMRCRINPEDDPRNLGESITKEKAEELQHRLKMVNGDEINFLKFSGVQCTTTPVLGHYEQIKTAKLPAIEKALTEKEQQGK